MRRGRYVLTGYRIATKFPFALFRKSRDVDAPVEVIVYPARVSVPRPPPRAQVRGDTTANRLGRRGEFFGLRERRTGDDRRDVHWKSSARTGRLLVREYEDEHARQVDDRRRNALPQDVRDAVTDGALAPRAEALVSAVERAISVAASLATSYLEAGWTVEVVARGLHVPAGSGRLHESRVLRALALLGYAADAEPFAPIPPRAGQRAGRAGGRGVGEPARGRPGDGGVGAVRAGAQGGDVPDGRVRLHWRRMIPAAGFRRVLA